MIDVPQILQAKLLNFRKILTIQNTRDHGKFERQPIHLAGSAQLQAQYLLRQYVDRDDQLMFLFFYSGRLV